MGFWLRGYLPQAIKISAGMCHFPFKTIYSYSIEKNRKWEIELMIKCLTYLNQIQYYELNFSNSVQILWQMGILCTLEEKNLCLQGLNWLSSLPFQLSSISSVCFIFNSSWCSQKVAFWWYCNVKSKKNLSRVKKSAF